MQKISSNVISFPLVIIDFLLVHFLKFKHTYLNEINEPYKELIKQRINDVFKDVGYNKDVFQNQKNDFHRLLIHYNYEFTKGHGHKLMNYVSLYGFLRVMTLISCLFLNYVFISYWITHSLQLDYKGIINFINFLMCLISLSTITFIFYLGYLKFYKRYTLENLMLILIIDRNINDIK